MKKIIIIFLCFFIFSLTGCDKKEIKTTINDEDLIAINYPITGINSLDDAISTYVNRTCTNFKKEYKNYNKPELNISYTYKELNDDIINVSLNTEINAGKKINKIKTFTYNKKTKKFLTMEDIIKDLDALDYNIKEQLLQKYKDRDIEMLTNINYDFFTIDDENLTLYLGPQISKEKGQELIYLDIPLNSLNLLIDIDKTENTDNYIRIKKKNIDYNDKIVALTFDDGPSKYTSKILDTLKKYDACGTFFVIGNKVEFYSKTIQRMIKEGSEIGNHTYNHKWLNRLSKNEFNDELNKTQEIVKKTTGFTPKLFRPTYGGYSDRLKAYTDLTFILWDVDSSDWKVKKKEKILNNIIPNVKDGSIVLMHDNHEYSVNAIETVIKTLKDKGYKFVTVSELLELKTIRENEWPITI